MRDSNQNVLSGPQDVRPPQCTLLQVEDNSANALLVETLIERRDLKLLTARDGYQGIEMALSHKPDLILMDINLPDISGLAAMKMLRENPATAHIPVIALSSNAYPRQIEEGLEAGFFRYLTKPFKVDEFMDAIDFALRYAAENRPLK
jgi:CheY-like chemotaxis protein